MDHTTFFPIPAPARYPVVGSSGNVVDIQTLPRHHPAWMREFIQLLRVKAPAS